jgi:hypothetical protein
MLAHVHDRAIDLVVLQEVPTERGRVGLDRAVELIGGEGVRRVLHRVGGDDEAVVAVGVR